MNNRKELEIQGCRKFICPNLSLIDEKGKELSLKDGTIKRAKELAMRFFKNTYHRPHYSSAKRLLPSFVYIASMVEDEKRLKKDIAKVFGVTISTITKWNRDIIKVMNLDISDNRKRVEEGTRIIKRNNIYIDPNLNLIDEGGDILGSDHMVVRRTKELATKYFNKISLDACKSPAMETILPSLLYLASIIENDRRTQMEIADKFNISESHVSKWHVDITDVLGIKIIYGCNRKVLKVIEERHGL